MEEVSEKTKQAIYHSILPDLNPPRWVVHGKITGALAVGGFLSLLLCGQFGMALTPFADAMRGRLMGLMGMLGCSATCALIFVVIPVIILRLISSPIQFFVLTHKNWGAVCGWVGVSGLVMFLAQTDQRQIDDTLLWILSATGAFLFLASLIRQLPKYGATLLAGLKSVPLLTVTLLSAQAQAQTETPGRIGFVEFSSKVSVQTPDERIDAAALDITSLQHQRAGLLQDPTLSISREDVPPPTSWRNNSAAPEDESVSDEPPAWTLTVTQMLPWPGTLRAEDKAAALRSDATRATNRAARDDRRFAAMELFLDMVKAHKAIEVQRKIQSESNAFRDFIHERYKQGIGSHMEFLQTHTESSLIAANLAGQEAELENLKLHAHSLLATPDGSSVKGPEFALDWPRSFTTIDAPSTADHGRDRIALARDQSTAERTVAYNRSLPGISLSAMGMQRDGGMRSVGGMVGISIPLYSNIERSALSSETAKVQSSGDLELAWYERRKTLVHEQTRNRIRTLAANLATIEKDILPKVYEHLQSAVASYGQGKGGVTRIIEGRRELLNMELARIGTTAALAKAHVMLARIQSGLIDGAIDVPIPAIAYAPASMGPTADMSGASMRMEPKAAGKKSMPAAKRSVDTDINGSKASSGMGGM